MGLLDNQTQQQYYQGNSFGNYQFISLENVIDNFMATYIGEDKILTTTKRSDVSFHAHRALQELSFDTFKSCKSQEIEVPPSLTMPLPQDYVNYVKLVWSDSSGIEHILYPAIKTSNPTAISQNSDGDYTLTADATVTVGTALITLDGEYKNILVGMIVDVPYNGINASYSSGVMKVYAVSNSGGVTSVVLQTVAFPNSIWVSTAAFETTMTFRNADGSLILQEESSHIIEGLTWNTTNPIMTATAAADIADIEVGMQIYNRCFDIGTTVTSINGTVITTSKSANLANTTNEDVTFISFEPISDTWSKYKSGTPSENQDDYRDNTYWPMAGERYGLDPQHAQTNGSFFIDCDRGMIHFSSNISGKTVILKYISDSLGTDPEMQVHKFAEEAMYKHIMYGCISAKLNVPEYIIARFKRERFAETRKAKLRLSNIKIEEITQILRGKSKQIKH